MSTLKRSFCNFAAVKNYQNILKEIKLFLDDNNVKHSTRIWGILKLYEENEGWTDLPRTLIYHEVMEVFEIIATLGHICPRMIVDAISKDNVDEALAKNKKGRNTQFELFIASKYKQAGYDIQFGEPDLFFYHRDNRYNIACKRPQSNRKILKRIKEASKQISSHNGFGIIALDLTPTSIKNFNWKSDLSFIIESGQDLIWNSFLHSKRNKIEELVGKNASIIHVYGGLNHKIQKSLSYALFDYALEIKSNRTVNDHFHEIINTVQSVQPWTALANKPLKQDF